MVAKQVSEQAAKVGTVVDTDDVVSVLADITRTSIDSLSNGSDIASMPLDSVFHNLSDEDRSYFADMLTSAVSTGEPVSDISRLAARRGFEATVTMYDGRIQFEKLDMTYEEAQAYVVGLVAPDSVDVDAVNAVATDDASGGAPDNSGNDGRRDKGSVVGRTPLSVVSFNAAAYSADSMKTIVKSFEGSGWSGPIVGP